MLRINMKFENNCPLSTLQQWLFKLIQQQKMLLAVQQSTVKFISRFKQPQPHSPFPQSTSTTWNRLTVVFSTFMKPSQHYYCPAQNQMPLTEHKINDTLRNKISVPHPPEEKKKRKEGIIASILTSITK